MAIDRSKADALQDRLIDFAVRIIHLATKLPKTPSGRHVPVQILKSGTAPAPNYGEARGAESVHDFVHKLRIALKELNETGIWLKIISKSGMIEGQLLSNVIEENWQLARIIASSINTASRRGNIKSQITDDKCSGLPARSSILISYL